MQQGKTLIRAVLGLLAAGVLVGAAAPASAAAARPSVIVGAHTAQPAVRMVKPAAAAADYNYVCFGYTGNFKSSSSILLVDWTADGSVDECFGIAPHRTIYHAWPGSGGWKVMPHNGLADDTDIAFRNSAGQHVVSVFVNNIGDYCSTLTSSWQPWVRCLN